MCFQVTHRTFSIYWPLAKVASHHTVAAGIIQVSILRDTVPKVKAASVITESWKLHPLTKWPEFDILPLDHTARFSWL